MLHEKKLNLTDGHLSHFLQCQVSRCGESGCKEESLSNEEEQDVYRLSSNEFLMNGFFFFWSVGPLGKPQDHV